METEGGVALKAVKLKVLYTFDNEHKNNHLARWPQSIEVQTAQIDDMSVIGLIDLRTCLEAVTTASPELGSHSENDYTIYAYDYSEPDTPLVGQGMLSKQLSQSDDEDADSESMVTGKITKSVMGLFSKNAQETLEVKLRFTPVSGLVYQRKRSGSVSSTPETVQQQWNSSSSTVRPLSPMDTSSLENMQRMLSEGGPPRDRSGSMQMDSYQYNMSRPGSRSGTPVQQQQHYNAPARPSISQGRSSSQTDFRQSSHARRDSFNSGYYSGEEVTEEGPARKRAKIQRVDWPSKSNLNIERQSDSLRVAASIASSVRLHRPVPINPAAAALQHHGSFEEPVRPPTPVPTKAPRPRGRPRKVVSANLLRGRPRTSSPARPPVNESSMSSPEDVRAESVISTPADLPSSPPVMPEQQSFVTSPALPPLLPEADSGFMSGNLEDLFGDELLNFGDFLHDKTDVQNEEADFQLDQPLNIPTTADLPPVFDENNEVDQTQIDMPAPAPPSRPAPPPAQRIAARSQSFTPGHRPIVPAPRLAPALAPRISQTDVDRSHSVLPQIPASDPVTGRSFQRSNTWAPDMSDAIMSDMGTANDEQARNRPRKRVGKEQTKARLMNAIASGEMPPFCDNCGAIETPAWRRGYIKYFECPWNEVQTSLEPGECCYKEPTEYFEDGKTIKKFKGYKVEKGSDDKSADGWVQICLCNPCGLWFHKSKCPRPPEKWQKKDPNEKRKRKRGPKPKKQVQPLKTSKGDAPSPDSDDDSSPADTSAEGGEMDENGDAVTTNGDGNDDNEPQLPPMPHVNRASSAEPVRGLRFHGLKHGATRQIKSSPARGAGTHGQPIELDLTPKPLRRQLFPSPAGPKVLQLVGAAEIVVNKKSIPTFVRRSPRINKTVDVFAATSAPAIAVTAGGEEKENVAPTPFHDDGLADLFEDQEDGVVMLPPSTPTPKRRSERLLLKTPNKTPGRDFAAHLSPNIQQSPSTKKTPKNGVHPIASIFLNTAQRNRNPAEMTPFTRSIHEAFADRDDDPQTPPTKRSERVRRTPRKVSPKDGSSVFEFPDLPPLKDSSPLSGNAFLNIHFSEMTTDRLHPDPFSTDAPMPSSPPPGFFDFDHHKDNDFQALWGDFDHQEEFGNMIDADMLHVEQSSGVPRRSPRKHHA